MRTTPVVLRALSPYVAGDFGAGAGDFCEGGGAETGAGGCAPCADTAGFPADESQDAAFLVPQPLRARFAGSGVDGVEVLIRIA